MADQAKRVLIEDWIPAAAIGVECMRERGSASALAPHTYLHVWWARRPLTVSRAAVLGSLLPADFPRDQFERLLGFGKPGAELVQIRQLMDTGYRVEGGFGADRAFKGTLDPAMLDRARKAIEKLWGGPPVVIDPMAGGGSIPLEAARLGFQALANEYNPVACSVLEVTVDYPFTHGQRAAEAARKWGKAWEKRIEKRLARFFPAEDFAKVQAYIFARTVPCPETGHETPLVPDWHLLKADGKTASVVAVPVVNKARGTWKVEIRKLGRNSGQLRDAPTACFSGGKGISLFTGKQITPEYIKTMAQQGKMRSALYAVALKTESGFQFRTAEPADVEALHSAEEELARLLPGWQQSGVLPIEAVPEGDKTGTANGIGTNLPIKRGERRWTDMFSSRQLLGMGVLVDELRALGPEVVKAEGKKLGDAVVHLLALGLDKFANHNCTASRWENTRLVIKGRMDRHDYSFKATFAEMAPCSAGSGLAWVLDNVLEAYEGICKLPRHPKAQAVTLSMGSATSMPQIEDGSIAAVVVDPPYADNVQYSELADFFYVWLKRTQGYRRPEWFSTYLCEHDQEAVVNIARNRQPDAGDSVKAARVKANEFYQKLMTETFAECRRILRDDGVLTVMFTHKKQEAWEALFSSLIRAGFIVNATWPVKTESEHSLNQAKKNAAQSTVILVARKRPPGTGVGYFDAEMLTEIRDRAREAAARLKAEGLNAVDQLVGSFGPAMQVYSRFDEVRTDTGAPVEVGQAIQEASDAVSTWRIEELASRGLKGVEPEGRFVLLCWDVLGAAEFRFNEAKLLGHAAGMDVDSLAGAGLVSKTGDKIKMLSARERRRERALEPDEAEELRTEGTLAGRRAGRQAALKVHPNDPWFRTALDGCHAMALRYLDAKGGNPGVGSAKALALQQRWGAQSAVARLIEALVRAAPRALWFERGKKSAAAMFPEFRAWHEILGPVFNIPAPEWKEEVTPQHDLGFEDAEDEEDEDGGGDEE